MNNDISDCDDQVIDRELGLKLAGNKVELADEMLSIIIKSLPKDLQTIQNAHANQNFSDLQKNLHKLLGAVCYCGLPRLKKSITNFETALKQNETSAYPNLLNKFEHEVNQVLEQAPEFKG